VRSRGSSPGNALSVILLTLLVTMPAHAQAPASPGDGRPGRPDAASITRAIEQVKADPNLATERKIHWLQWRKEQSKPMPGWLRWLLGLAQWIEQQGRALVWVSAAVLAAFLAVFITRVLRTRSDARAAGRLTPTHVQDLDIRPESLPADIGAAARALWDRGEHRAALALLYRGLLSRLAHVHAVPIRDSTTEGACLTLAATHLTEERHEYVSRLVRVWQRSVYGGQDAETSAVYALCLGFGPALDPAPATGASLQP
jgi:hypothetical protein